MILENVFMIRGGDFGEEFSIKLIMSLMALIICIYDWYKNDRKDYFWVFFVGTLIWTFAEIGLQVSGTRTLNDKYFFGLNVTNALWLTIPLQGCSEGATISILGVFFGDHLLNKETRKRWSLYFSIFLSFFLLYLLRGINFTTVNAGDLTIPSRRDMFPLFAIIFTVVLISIMMYWFTIANNKARKRAAYMFSTMLIFVLLRV